MVSSWAERHCVHCSTCWLLLLLLQLKERQGVLGRIAPTLDSAICSGLFKKETDMAIFERAKVVTGRGEEGYIDGRFGTSGKCKLQFSRPLLPLQQRSAADNVVLLRYKRFVFDQDKHKIRQ